MTVSARSKVKRTSYSWFNCRCW